jgi:hypothetical protein
MEHCIMLGAAPNLHHDDFEHKARQVRAAHAEIALRYGWQARQNGMAWPAYQGRKYERGSPQMLCRIRLGELEDLYRWRYGATLPYDRAGIEDLTIAAHHIVGLGGEVRDHIVAWARKHMPAIPDAEAKALAERVLAEPRRFKAATLGWRLQLTDSVRTALKITSIRAFDVSEAETEARRKAKAAERAARSRERRKSGRPPKAAPLYQTQPWRALGMSQSTWYRRGKPSTPEEAAAARPVREKKTRAQQVVVAKKKEDEVSKEALTAAHAIFSHANGVEDGGEGENMSGLRTCFGGGAFDLGEMSEAERERFRFRCDRARAVAREMLRRFDEGEEVLR